MNPKKGQKYRFYGNWINHPTFGRQFKIDRFVEVRPESRAEIVRFLSNGILPGVGPKLARSIVETFGKEVFNILDQNPSMLHNVPKLGRKKVAGIISAWKENHQLNAVSYTHLTLPTNREV